MTPKVLLVDDVLMFPELQKFESVTSADLK